MSAAVMPALLDNRRHSSGSSSGGKVCRLQQCQMSYPDSRYPISVPTTASALVSQSRHRNLSGPTATTTRPRPTLDNRQLATPPPGVPGARDKLDLSVNPHRKLDRSHSDSEDRINGNQSGRGVNSARYKTELCRPFEESGHCKYGDKCQFAHGGHELRNLTRHPKYKTELCRTFHTVGFCPYGPRCHFIHNDEEMRGAAPPSKNCASSSSGARSAAQQQRYMSSIMAQRPNNLSGLNSIGSSFESVSSASSPGNLSPLLPDDGFPPVTTFSPSCVQDLPPPSSSSSKDSQSSSSSIFTFPASDSAACVGGSSVLTPLNIQTQQFFQNFMNLSTLAHNQRNNNLAPDLGSNLNHAHQPWPVGYEGLDLGLSVPPPSTSPTTTDDSMGSTSSLEVSGESVGLGNPLEVGRCMRLPIFNRLSNDL